ncbi:MAG: tetratricopeptide repeat protein [Planctomycetota bacterium]|jgi:tetratricopeptide (TPR) repeat protein
MNLAGWRFVLFALTGTAAIVLLASIGIPDARRVSVDRHTGERESVIRKPAQAIQEVRVSGNARTALKALRKRIAHFEAEKVPKLEELYRIEAVLSAELGGLSEPIPPTHPDADKITDERRLAESAKRELSIRARAREVITPESAVALLGRLDADEHIAAATEAVFEKLGTWELHETPSAQRPDELAAKILAYLAETEVVDDEDLFLALIRAFRSEDRQPARLRWALRAFGTLPRSRAIVDELTKTYLEQGRLLEALVVVGAALTVSPDDFELWKLRAKFAGWQSLPHAEIEARENLLREEDLREHRERIVQLYREVGEPGRAVTHAEELASGSTDKDVLLGPVLLALDSGDTDRALAMLAKLADASDDPVWWREKIIHYAQQDMRADRVISELDWLRKHDPDGDYEQRLEGTLRRRGRHEALADLLDERLKNGVEDPELEQELIQLRYILGHEDKALSLLRRRMERSDDPAAFFRALPTYRQLEIPGAAARAREMAQSPKLTAEAVPAALLDLLPLVEEAPYREVAIDVARRFPHSSEAREFRFLLVDRLPDDPARAAAAARVAAEFPDDPDYQADWAKRAGWAHDKKGEAKARARIVKLRPSDLENREALADIYDAQNKPEESLEQWRVIADAKGMESDAQLRLVDVLLATDNIEEATQILENRARLPGATLDDQLHVGEQLYGRGHYDRALRFYDAVLEREPQHALALLREGRIKAWSNDPRGAIPMLQRRLAVSEEESAAVRFTLGECYWAIGEPREARLFQEESLASFLAQPERTVEDDVMVAKMLARFGREEEARPIFDRIVTARPGDADLLLDYADAMVSIGDLARARPLVDQAREHRPDYVRGVRLDGTLALQEKRYEVAASTLGDALQRFGPDAGTASELGRALHLAGDYGGSYEAYKRAHVLQPDNEDLDEELRVMEDQLAKMLHVHAEARRVSDDLAVNGWLAGSTLLKRGRTRAGLLVGAAHYSGRADAVDAGQTDVTTDIVRADLAVTHRFYRRSTVGGGVGIFAGANGNTPVSGWVGASFVGERPTWKIALRAWANELFSDPAAAAGLGGRSTGGLLEGETDIGKRFWVAGRVRYESISLEFADADPHDPRLIVAATIGWRAIEGPARVASRHRIERPVMPGVVGSMLGKELSDRKRSMLSVWLNAATYQVLDDAQLSQLIPLGERFDYLTLAARFDRHLANDWGVMVEGYAGRELQEEQNVYGLAAGVGWRPKDSFELALVGAYGSALGRSNDEATLRVRLGLTWRW